MHNKIQSVCVNLIFSGGSTTQVLGGLLGPFCYARVRPRSLYAGVSNGNFLFSSQLYLHPSGLEGSIVSLPQLLSGAYIQENSTIKHHFYDSRIVQWIVHTIYKEKYHTVLSRSEMSTVSPHIVTSPPKTREKSLAGSSNSVGSF